MTENKPPLLRALTLTDAIAMVVGTVMGTGVFLKTPVMLQQPGSPTLVAWLVINTILQKRINHFIEEFVK